ncbi:hypothetical protein NDN16_18475 [Aureimonas altamirensis]|uniref:hypothetical protein n=1 Tax=Aureimonas altamirensis TaxID=370622 RepID=UPI002036F8E4|nr:hypothetical protein [Aureimonas altamirensis]MCM2505656.1 hypothetical protein [Aureimonas altamirensis]
MSRIIRYAVAPALIMTVLAGCASIENRGLPKCSGNDRRPLNADLWAWSEGEPSAPATVMQFGPIPTPRPDSALGAVSGVVEPEWNIAASERACV